MGLVKGNYVHKCIEAWLVKVVMYTCALSEASLLSICTGDSSGMESWIALLVGDSLCC